MNERSKGKTSTDNLDLHALDAVLETFVNAAQDPHTTRAELYENFHRRILACTQSTASAVFSKRANSQFSMVSHAGWNQLSPTLLGAIKESIKSHYAGDNPVSLSAAQPSVHVGKSKAVNDVEFLYVLVRDSESNDLVDQVFQDLTDEVARQIESYEIRRSIAHKPKTTQDLTHLVQIAQNVGRSKNLTQVSMHLVNDLAKSTGADRVCFFQANGKLNAVSGVSQVSLKTSFARNLSRLARIAQSSHSPVESAGDQLVFGDVPRLNHVKPLIDSLQSEIVYVSPVEHEGDCCGVVSFEFFQQENLKQDWIDKRNLLIQSLAFVAPVVHRAVEINSIPGISVLDFVFNKLLKRPVRALLGMAAIGAVLLAGLYFLLVVERPFEIHAEGVLQPTVKRNIFAPREGEIQELFVAEGSLVEAGQKLAQLDSKDLRDRMIVVEGELAEANQQLQNLTVADLQNNNDIDSNTRTSDQQTQTASDIERLKAKTETLRRRLELFERQVAELTLTAPIQGRITTPDIDDRLHLRPVNRGDLLMAISAMDGQWEIQLKVPDNRVEFVKTADAPAVRFRLAADSETLYMGEIREFDYRVNQLPADTQTFVHALVDINETELGDNLLLGSRVIAKIHCGQRNNLFLLTYELRNKIKEWFFF